MVEVKTVDPATGLQEPSHADPLDDRHGSARLGLARLLRPRKRDWCCESCRLAAEPQQQTW